MRERNFAIKSNYSSLSCLNSGEFIKKTGAKTVFSFISTKEQKLQQSLHKKSAHSVLISASKAPNNRAEEAGKKANSSQKIKTEFGAKQKFILLLSGAFIGMLNGFFGGGGGMVCVPILEKVLSLDSKHSHATAIAVIFPLSLISAIIYVVNGSVETMPLLTVGLGVVAGGILGAFALKFLPPKVVQILFAIVMFAGGIKLIL